MGNLRRLAETKLATPRTASPPPTEGETQRLRHELEVHQIELELQNRELRAAQGETTATLERYTDLFDFAPVGYFNLSEDGNIRLVNLTGARLVGIDRASLVGRRLGLLVELSDRRAFSDFLAAVFSTGIKRDCELSLAAEDRPQVIVRLEASVTPDGRECRAVMTDITDRKRAERALVYNASFTEDVLNSLTDHVVVLDSGGTIIAVNESWRRFARENGAHDTDFTGMNYLTVCRESIMRGHPAGAARAEAGIRAMLGGARRDFTLEYPCDSPDEARWFRMRVAPLSGGRHGVVVSHHDVSESKRAEETVKLSMAALKMSERRFKTLFDHAAVGMALADATTGIFVQINQRYCQITGYERTELERLTLTAILHPEDAGQDLEMSEKLRSGVIREYTREKRYVRKDHSEIWVSLTVSAMWAAGDAPDFFIAVVQDITGRRLLEEQVRQAQKMDAIGTLAGGIAHDFNNILAAIIGYTELSLMMRHEDVHVRENLSAVLQAASRATHLVRQIVSFSRQQAPRRLIIPLGPIVAECSALLRATIPTTIAFDISLSPDAPAVLADAAQIHQILMNLGTNAWHAMNDRAGRLGIRLEKCTVNETPLAAPTRLPPGDYARISVRDTGCGMDPATLLRIFEPFFTTKGVGKGTGLGLAVVQGIMDNHEGIISVHSTPGKGTVFDLYFPGKVGAETPADSTGTETPRGHGERLLIVDDEEMLVQMCRLTLTELGYEVETTTNPEEALTRVRGNPGRFALVLTDQTMPEMTGLALAAQLQLIRPGLPVILTTGYIASLTPEQIKAAGIRQLLRKPSTLHNLGVAIHEVLATAQ